MKAFGRKVVHRAVAPEIDALHRELIATQHRFAALEEEHDAHRAAWTRRFDQLLDIDRRLAALTVNQELLKDEVRHVLARIEAVGAAIAPGAGIDAAGDRIGELRERLGALERRVRTVLGTGAAPAAVAPPATASTADERERPRGAARAEVAATELFDYAGFEQRFRGSAAEILHRLETRYLHLLRDAGPVLDVGCGRGELVGLLRNVGTEAYGIDLDSTMVAEARADGLDVRHEDAVTHLRGLEPGSLGAIISTQVVEHLELATLLEFIELGRSRLRPGGLFIAETPNPGTLIVLANSYILDPTHEWPLHPALLSFLCESAGFRQVAVEYFSPAEEFQLRPLEGPSEPWVDQINESFERLNAFLFGPQDYAVVARTP
jgi:SAM-dependent methyltransferase